MGLTLYIIRHGNTFKAGETPRRVGSRTDLPLVDSGREQARALGQWFVANDIRFDAAFTSPLRRTRETALFILAPQAHPPGLEPADWLAEIDHGPDEDQPEAAVVDRIGAEALNAWDADGVAPCDWVVNAEARRAAWQRLFDVPSTARDRTLLLVTSNGAARFALLADPGLHAQAKALPSLKLRTGTFGRIVVDVHGPRLMEWDQRPALRPA
jgi:broad specificity phosphatase PhoE